MLAVTHGRRVDFTKLKIEKGDFIDSEDKERFTDLLYSVPIMNKAARLGIFCLVEHKSYKDKNIHSQLLLYLAGIYQKHKYPVWGDLNRTGVFPAS